MLISRVYKPKPEEVFYHYCSIETFQAICEYKTLRFSDINLMNDFHEQRWGYQTFERAATALLNDQEIQQKTPRLDRAFFDRVDSIVSSLQTASLPIIASLSKEPDVLSQWRAYADDGRGVAVGFNGAILGAMPTTLLEVQYDESLQLDEMKMALRAIHLQASTKGHSFDAEVRRSCQLLSFWMLGFKNPAFSEEKEIRCLHALALEYENDRPRLIYEVGKEKERTTDAKSTKVKYRVRNRLIVPYVDIPLPTLNGDTPLIQEVWLGPGNVNSPNGIMLLMSECGLTGYTLNRSRASYRVL